MLRYSILRIKVKLQLSRNLLKFIFHFFPSWFLPKENNYLREARLVVWWYDMSNEVHKERELNMKFQKNLSTSRGYQSEFFSFFGPIHLNSDFWGFWSNSKIFFFSKNFVWEKKRWKTDLISENAQPKKSSQINRFAPILQQISYTLWFGGWSQKSWDHVAMKIKLNQFNLSFLIESFGT